MVRVQRRFVLRSHSQQHEPYASVGRLAEPLPNLGPHAELLLEFPDESCRVRLPGLDLAPRELPATGELGRPAAARGQYPTVADERRRHDKGHSGIVPGPDRAADSVTVASRPWLRLTLPAVVGSAHVPRDHR